MSRLDYPATARNRDPILAVLREALPATGLVLEIASGSGQHVAWFAPALPGLVWQPSDPDPRCRASVDAWCAGLPGVRPALALDVRQEWPIAAADAVWCANMIHIAPWEATLGLVAGAARILAPGAPLVLYGPFRIDGEPFAPSNEAFDADLRRRDPSWGVRSLADVLAAAPAFALDRCVAMPANNQTVVLRRR